MGLKRKNNIPRKKEVGSTWHFPIKWYLPEGQAWRPLRLWISMNEGRGCVFPSK